MTLQYGLIPRVVTDCTIIESHRKPNLQIQIKYHKQCIFIFSYLLITKQQHENVWFIQRVQGQFNLGLLSKLTTLKIQGEILYNHQDKKKKCWLRSTETLKKAGRKGPQVAQSIKGLPLDFGTGHDFKFVGSSLVSGSTWTVGSLLEILFLTVSLPAPIKINR